MRIRRLTLTCIKPSGGVNTSEERLSTCWAEDNGLRPPRTPHRPPRRLFELKFHLTRSAVKINVSCWFKEAQPPR